MNTEIEDIILTHDYSELDAEQLALVQDWASSEEEYATMRQIMNSAPLLNADIEPSPALKNSLMETFAKTYPAATVPTIQQEESNKKGLLFLFLRSAAAVAAILLLAFLMYPFFRTSDETPSLAKNQKIKKEQPFVRENEEDKKDNSQPEKEETPVQIAQLERPTPGNSIDDASDDVFEPMVDDAYVNGTSSYAAPTMARAESASFDEVAAGAHSDRIAMKDLPEGARQIIHENPEILDFLHTSF